MFMLEGSQSLAFSITEGLQKSNKKTQKRLAKNAERRKKYEVKANGGSPLPPTNAEKMVDQIISDRNGGAGDGGSATPPASPMGGNNAGAPSSGSDDISDIL